MTVAEAEEALRSERLELGERTEYHDESAIGGVILGQTPAPGELVDERSAIAVDVSLGRCGGEMLPVPAATFPMGRTRNEARDDGEWPVHDVTLSAYWIGKYEVTNAEFVEALNWANGKGYIEVSGEGKVYAHGKYVTATSPSYYAGPIGFDGERFFVQENYGYYRTDHAVSGVSWYGAAAYCNWRSEQEGLPLCYDFETWKRIDPVPDSYRLPTEAEWECAAAWDAVEERMWRYGFASDEIDLTRCNYGESEPLGPLAGDIKPIGYYDGVHRGTALSVSPVGAFDMTGNVAEWCQDWYAPYTFPAEALTDPAGPEEGGERLRRGGDTGSGEDRCVASARMRGYTAARNGRTGFRIARSK